jgi:hypothetical protein
MPNQTKKRNPQIEKEYGGIKTQVYIVKTELVPKVNDISDPLGEILIFGPTRGGVRKVVIYTNRDLNEEGVDLRIKWLVEYNRGIACVKCGYKYDGGRYIKVVATRNGTLYHDVVCDRCDPRLGAFASIATG